MFAPMHLLFRCSWLLPLLICLHGCQTPSRTGSSDARTDTTWAGEVSVLEGKPLFRPCGQENGSALRGPALDTLLNLYRSQSIQPGQRMMVWFTGHMVAPDTLGTDSFFHIAALGHLDALRMCPLMPVPRLAARYSTTLVEHLGNRSLTLDLHPNGTALQLTEMRDQPIPFEQEGRWGADGSGVIEVDLGPSFPKGYYTVSGDSLVRIQSMTQGSLPRFLLVRSGPPDPSAGVRGLVLNWLSAVAKAQCGPFDPAKATPSTRIAALLPTPEAMHALEDSAITWLPLDTTALHIGEQGLVTIGDLTALKRRAMLLRP
jgi:hypothetical protein